MTDAAERTATLPTGALLAAGWIGPLAAGAGWGLVGWASGFGATQLATGAAAAGVVGAAATITLVALRPWHPRTLYTWPIAWVAGSFGRMVITLAGAFLLYSATQLGGSSLWFAVVLAYVAAMIGETRVYARSMQRYGPGGADSSTPE